VEEAKYSWGDEGLQWAARLDVTTDELVMQVTIPNKSYLAIGFGEDMRGTDMIIWRWKDDVVEVDNLFSTGYTTPESDGTDFLTTTIEDSKDRQHKIFTTRRALDTGSKDDFVVPLDKPIVMCYAYRTGSGDFIEHQEHDIFSVMFSSSGIASKGSLDLS